MNNKQTGRGGIFDNMAATMGNTPLVRLHRLPAAHNVNAEILAKLEFFNPLASVKDRIGVAMIDDLEQSGALNPAELLLNQHPAIPVLHWHLLLQLRVIDLS